MRIIRTLFWWTVLIITLLIIDDLLFGPLFWALSLVDQVLSTVIAFIVSFCLQLWLIREALAEKKSKVARWLLNRLTLERSNRQIAMREESIKRSVVSVGAAFLATLLIGGVITSILLRSKSSVRGTRYTVISVVLCALYAFEFALIHGGWGLGAFLRAVVL